MKRWLTVAALALGVARLGAAQIPRLPSVRGTQPVKRDTTKDSTRIKWPAPDTAAQRLLQMKGYSITRYQGDTAYLDADKHSLDLLAAPKRRAAVDRDTMVIVSDSGIYYTEGNHLARTGGHYVITPPPSSGQADVNGFGYGTYSMTTRTARLTNAHLPVNNGEMWYMSAQIAEMVLDSTSGKKAATAYMRSATITSCDDSIPDYYFQVHDAKRTSGNAIIGRPAVLVVEGVPVMWFPFMFSDNQPGRHSGILVPQFGLGDIVRNSPSYRRNIDHAGYYWAINNYTDFATWLDWRSSAGATDLDPGWIKFNTDWSYKWLDRFLSGRIGASYTMEGNGPTNTALSWTHSQEFNRDTHLTTNVNYVSSTTLQRQNTFDPYTALNTIQSSINYNTKLGPATVTLGATRKQYPGRTQVEQTFPTVSLTTTAIGGTAFNWTPALSFSLSGVQHMDQPGLGAFNYFTNSAGLRDSTPSTRRNSANNSLDFETPVQIFGWQLQNSFKVNQQRQNFPQQFSIYDVNTGLVTDTRIFAATYNTSLDWVPVFQLPSIGHNKFNLSPSFSFQNVDPGSPYMVASERTNGRFATQSKRITLGASATPTVYGLFGGIGPFSAIRHALTPSVTYNWAPAGTVSDDFLIALGRTRKGYLGDLPESQVSFGLNQTFEAKIRAPKADTSSNPTPVQPIKLLSLNFSPISYDFIRADSAHRKLGGITTDAWNYSATSDLLPGFDFAAQYSLFEGSVLSDTARFKPYLVGITAGLSMSRSQNPITMLRKLFGQPTPPPPQPKTAVTPADSQALRDSLHNQSTVPEQALASQPVAGSARRDDHFIQPPTDGWKLSLQLTRQSPRPPKDTTGSNVINFDPTTRCKQETGGNPFLFDQCLANQRAQSTFDTPVTSATAGGPVYNIPATTSVNADLTFNLTPKWSTHWQTTYDLEHHQFAQHIVQLQRELHDWRAAFGFTQSQNGNFAFTFRIALKADPDLKFDYNRATARSGQPF